MWEKFVNYVAFPIFILLVIYSFFLHWGEPSDDEKAAIVQSYLDDQRTTAQEAKQDYDAERASQALDEYHEYQSDKSR